MDCNTNSQSLPKPMSIKSVMPLNHLILCRPLLLLPSIFPSNRVFSNELALHIKWPKYWSFSFNISPSNEHSGAISFLSDYIAMVIQIWREEPVGYSPQGCKRVGHNLVTKQQYKLGLNSFSQFSSVQFSHSVVSNSLRPHELQHARPPCPSPTPRVYSNSCSSSQ